MNDDILDDTFVSKLNDLQSNFIDISDDDDVKIDDAYFLHDEKNLYDGPDSPIDEFDILLDESFEKIIA